MRIDAPASDRVDPLLKGVQDWLSRWASAAFGLPDSEEVIIDGPRLDRVNDHLMMAVDDSIGLVWIHE